MHAGAHHLLHRSLRLYDAVSHTKEMRSGEKPGVRFLVVEGMLVLWASPVR